MTRALAALLAASISTAGLALPVHAHAAGLVANAEPSPEELYEQGRKAYRVGKFKEAVDAWEKSFAASDNPLLLYNISLAYRGLYGISGDIDDLKRARAVLENFLRVAEADPALQSEIGDAQTRIAEIDKELKEAEARAKAAAEKNVPPPKVGPSKDEIRGKRLRIAGAVTMGVGGVLVITGVAVGAYMAITGGDFKEKLKRAKQRATNELNMAGVDDVNGCIDDAHEKVQPNEACMPEGSDAGQALSDVAYYRRVGNKANTTSIVSFAVIGGLGLVGVITGAVLFAQGNRLRTKRVADLRVSPVFAGRSMTGLSLTGRF
jgi:tetratricopeptide (TPR) repeat protein